MGFATIFPAWYRVSTENANTEWTENRLIRVEVFNFLYKKFVAMTTGSTPPSITISSIISSQCALYHVRITLIYVLYWWNTIVLRKMFLFGACMPDGYIFKFYWLFRWLHGITCIWLFTSHCWCVLFSLLFPFFCFYSRFFWRNRK